MRSENSAGTQGAGGGREPVPNGACRGLSLPRHRHSEARTLRTCSDGSTGGERGPEKGPEGDLCFQKEGCLLPTAPLSHPVPSSTGTSLGPQPDREHIGGFPECIIPKVKPHTEALGAGPRGGSRTHGNPDSGKGKETISCGKQSWQLGCIRGEGQGKVRGQSTASLQSMTHSYRHKRT